LAYVHATTKFAVYTVAFFSVAYKVPGYAPHDALIRARRAAESTEFRHARLSDTTYSAHAQPSLLLGF
jgi:hypothetical protein